MGFVLGRSWVQIVCVILGWQTYWVLAVYLQLVRTEELLLGIVLGSLGKRRLLDYRASVSVVVFKMVWS